MGRADAKTWWRNLRSPTDVGLWLAGDRLHARAVAVVGAEQPAECRRGLLAYLAKVPTAAATLGIPDASDHVAVAGAVPSVVMVRADLRPEPDEAA